MQFLRNSFASRFFLYCFYIFQSSALVRFGVIMAEILCVRKLEARMAFPRWGGTLLMSGDNVLRPIFPQLKKNVIHATNFI
jgi:hypothetical protein